MIHARSGFGDIFGRFDNRRLSGNQAGMEVGSVSSRASGLDCDADTRLSIYASCAVEYSWPYPPRCRWTRWLCAKFGNVAGAELVRSAAHHSYRVKSTLSSDNPSNSFGGGGHARRNATRRGLRRRCCQSYLSSSTRIATLKSQQTRHSIINCRVTVRGGKSPIVSPILLIESHPWAKDGGAMA
jgi:hypothetical protein